jgi:hypothetical protein
MDSALTNALIYKEINVFNNTDNSNINNVILMMIINVHSHLTLLLYKKNMDNKEG